MSADHHELRMAFSGFLAAQRALRDAYRKTGVVHGRVQARPILASRASGRAENERTTSPELEELKERNEKLTESLALLHAYSLNVHEQRDVLMTHTTTLLHICEAAVSWMRQDCRTNEGARPLLSELDQAIALIKARMQCGRR
jgi:hypothetical protein